MNTKTLTLLAGATAVLAVGTWFLESGREGGDSSPEETLLLPALSASAAQAARLVVTGPEGVLTLEQADGGWALAERNGFPVQATKVRDLLSNLARSKRLERKTSNPARYGDLGLEDVGAEGSNSTSVRIESSSGEVLGEALIGRRRAQGAAAHYIRLPDEPTTWLASGELRVAGTMREWIDTEVTRIKRDRLVGVDLIHPDGTVVQLARTEESDANLSIQNTPEGMVPSSDWITSRFSTALEFLSLEDVQPRELPDPERAVAATFRTKDGLVLTATSTLLPAEEGGQERLLVNLDASFDPNPPLPWAGPLAPGVDPSPSLEGEEEPETALSPEEVQAEVEALNAKFADWSILLSGYRKNVFQCRMEELVKVEEPPAEEEESTTPEGSAPVVPAPLGTGEGSNESPSSESPSAESPSSGPPATVPDDGR